MPYAHADLQTPDANHWLTLKTQQVTSSSMRPITRNKAIKRRPADDSSKKITDFFKVDKNYHKKSARRTKARRRSLCKN
jgi:hypothetical protein